MLGKTHIAVGCAIYFYIAQPTDFKSLFADVAISIIGSEVSDIDEANSKVRHVFSWHRVTCCSSHFYKESI